MAALSPNDAPKDLGEIARVREKDSQVWDMVMNLIHPVAFYVLFQLLIFSHLGRTPALSTLHPLHPIPLGLYLLQFLGAWSVFYTVLLRDMGFRCPEGTILLLVGLLGVVTQYFLFPNPVVSAVWATWTFGGLQWGLAAVAWPITFLRWRRHKREAAI